MMTAVRVVWQAVVLTSLADLTAIAIAPLLAGPGLTERDVLRGWSLLIPSFEAALREARPL
jgi:hypothetical protein